MNNKYFKTIVVYSGIFFLVMTHGVFAQSDGHTDHSHGDVTDNTEDKPLVMPDKSGNIGYVNEEDVSEGVVVNLSVSANPTLGATTTFQFNVRDLITGTPITNLEIEHEKFIHVIGVRDDMEEFLHIHPVEIAQGKWEVDYVFEKPGKYKLWSDVRHNGVTKHFGHPMVIVAGPGLRSEPQSRLVKNIIVGNNYQIAIDHNEPIVAGEPTEVHFIIKNILDETVELEPFLSAQMHVAVLSKDINAYIHAHPSGGDHGHDEMDTMMDEQSDMHSTSRLIKDVYAHGDENADRNGTHVPFLITFPKDGMYRLYAQFRPEGVDLPEDTALVAKFDVKVEKGKVTKPPLSSFDPQIKWWSLLVISLILIMILSFGVFKFLKVK